MTKYAGTLAKSISQSFFLALKTETRQEEETMLGHFVQTDKQTNSQIMSKDKNNRTCWPSLNSHRQQPRHSQICLHFFKQRGQERAEVQLTCVDSSFRGAFLHALLKIDDVDKGFFIYITTVSSMEYANPTPGYVNPPLLVSHNFAIFSKLPTIRHYKLQLGA